MDKAVSDLWWKNAIVYCLDVETFADSDGDGIGDFRGLTDRLDHLADLGVTCIWLMPFYPSPNRDDGYDVTDYYGIDPRLGDFGDFTEFMRSAGNRGMRVIADLVVNHTSIDHPWFQRARNGPDDQYHDYYVWQDERPEDWETALVFPGEQIENWTYDRKAGRYYLHNFYRHQPDLNPNNPELRDEMRQVLSFWAKQDLSGFRVDAVPFLIELRGIDGQIQIVPHEFLEDLSEHLRRRTGDAVLLGEVNLHPSEQVEFFGDDGDELQMVFSFYINQYLHLALARRDADPLRKALDALPPIPETGQWANFLTNHDELTLDKLTEAEREEVFGAFGPEEGMQLFGRGIRRRLPPMLGGDERLIRCAYSLLFSLPGTPVLFYGEEIGMGENLDIPGRRAVRSPMQWSDHENAGFSSSPTSDLIRPITSGEYGPKRVNVEDQQRDLGSMLSFMRRLVRVRRRVPELGMGEWTTFDTGSSGVLGHRSTWGGRTVLALHNLSTEAAEVELDPGDRRVSILWIDDETAADVPTVTVASAGYVWLRLLDPSDHAPLS